MKLPWQKPQIISVRAMPNGRYRTAIMDRFDRMTWLDGEHVGFDIIVFQTMKFPKITRLVFKDDFSQALFRNWEGQTLEVECRIV